MTSRSQIALAAVLGLLAVAITASPAAAHVSQPRAVIDRPRTLPGGELEVNAGVDLDHTSNTVNNMTTSNTDIRAPLALGYGFSNDLDLHFLYGVLLRPIVTGKQPAEVRLGYTFVRDGAWTAAARVMSGIDLGNNTVTPLRLGVNAQYRIAATVAVFTPGEQLTVTLSGTPKRVALDLPIGVALQLTPDFYLAITTSLAHINVANDGNAFILRDMIPVDAVAFYSLSSAVDLGAHLDVDLKSTNRVVFGVIARLFF